MKKKIGDLTLKELSELCIKRKDCNDCPLLDVCGEYIDTFDEELEIEIEVEDE